MQILSSWFPEEGYVGRIVLKTQQEVSVSSGSLHSNSPYITHSHITGRLDVTLVTFHLWL